MKLVERNAQSITFALSQRDCELLVFLLRLYPVLDPTFHRITRSAAGNAFESEQQILTESVTTEQNANRGRVDQFIRNRLTPRRAGGNSAMTGANFHLTLTWTEADWLLRLINDVRVGCWVRLGRPDTNLLHSLQIKAAQVPDFAAMELGGLVQHTLLDALDG